MRALADRLGIFDHIGDEAAENAVVEIVHHRVALDHRRGEIGVAGGESVERVVHHFGRYLTHGGEEGDRLQRALVGGDQGNALGDILGIVADAFDHADDLQRSDDVAQVVGHGRAQGDDLDYQLFNFRLYGVDALVVGDHLRGERLVLPLEGNHRILDGRFGAAAHFGDEAAQLVDFLVKRLDRMFCHYLSPRISRSGR